jgi:predicted transcriptional regulator
MSTNNQDKSSKAFRDWRRRMDFTQKQAAHALELGWSTVRCYDSGKRFEPDGSILFVKVPRIVLLACQALENKLEPIR